MDIKNRINFSCIYAKIPKGELAKKINSNTSNLTNRMKRAKFTFEELREIAQVLNCEAVFKFRFDDGTEFSSFSIENMIKDACAYVGMPLLELGEKQYGSRQNFRMKLKRGKFTQDEIEKMAAYIGCEYVTYFEFPDGKRF